MLPERDLYGTTTILPQVGNLSSNFCSIKKKCPLYLSGKIPYDPASIGIVKSFSPEGKNAETRFQKLLQYSHLPLHCILQATTICGHTSAYSKSEVLQGKVGFKILTSMLGTERGILRRLHLLLSIDLVRRKGKKSNH